MDFSTVLGVQHFQKQYLGQEITDHATYLCATHFLSNSSSTWTNIIFSFFLSFFLDIHLFGTES
jgi:hypothetical protein